LHKLNDSKTSKTSVGMMQITFNAPDFSPDARLINFIEHKLYGLDRYFDRPVHVEVCLKLQDTGKKIDEKITEVKIHVPGGWIMDKKTGNTFEATVTASYESIRRQLVRIREGGRVSAQR
jgi:putative sigma-54 modulation protein